MKHFLFAGCLVLAAHTAYCEGEAAGSALPATAQAAEQPGNFSGKVIETTNTAGYTYVRVDTGAKKLWAAAPSFEVKVGDTAAVADGMPMAGYHSKTLDRDFDLVYFTGNVTVNGARPGTGAPMPELPKNHPPVHGAAPTAPLKLDFSKLQKPEGGHTVQQINAGKAKLAGQEVKVRGKVVKYNEQIMGKNWLHLRDGTGTEGSNDLLVTTGAKAKVGDTVLVTGKVSTNKDFGMNYKYAVLIEDAKVVVE
jgi:hypothetical protein